METKLLQFSIVIAGKAHNPTILNPDFLSVRGIVPPEWNWETTEATITTPPFSVVNYKQGVSITVEHEKLNVVDAHSKQPSESRIPEIVKRYLATLPHVRYTAVGINFHGIVRAENPNVFLRERFLKAGKWNSSRWALEALGLRFVYPLTSGKLVLSLDVGEVQEQERGEEHSRDVIIARANFHRDCTTYPADQQVVGHVEKHIDDWSSYKQLIHDLLDPESTTL